MKKTTKATSAAATKKKKASKEKIVKSLDVGSLAEARALIWKRINFLDDAINNLDTDSNYYFDNLNRACATLATLSGVYLKLSKDDELQEKIAMLEQALIELSQARLPVTA